MADQWLFKSETYDNCNCAVNCGCQFNLPSTRGYCQSAFVGNIVEGHFNDTPLASLNWAALYKWPGEIKNGNGKRQIVIDERADEAQRIALETIISGEAGAPLSNLFSVFASTCSEFCKTLFLPIDLEANFELRTARVDIPGVLKSSGRPIINEFTGQPFHIALARRSGSFEFTYAEIGLGTTSVAGDMEMAYEDSWAHYCVHHFNQDGLVRERSRLSAWLSLRDGGPDSDTNPSDQAGTGGWSRATAKVLGQNARSGHEQPVEVSPWQVRSAAYGGQNTAKGPVCAVLRSRCGLGLNGRI
jgi:hypothetical protein